MSISNKHLDENRKSPAEVLSQMIAGLVRIQLIYVAAKLGIADLLKDRPKNSEELAESVGAHPRTLYRVLRALSSLGVFTENENSTFELTPVSELLQTGAPGSLRSKAIFFGEEWVWRPLGKLLHSVKTGENAFDHIFAMNVFDYYSQNPEAGEIQNALMTNVTVQEGPAILDAYDFSGIEKIVDVGGGHGTLIAAILKAYPLMHGVLAEVPSVIDGAKGSIESKGLVDRCELVAVDFFNNVPKGGDAYILKRVIYDWEDDRAVIILKNCRKVIANRGRLLLMETVIPSSNEPHPGKVSDIFMMLVAGGLMRSEVEFEQLLNAADFRLTRIVPTESGMSIVEGVPA